MYGQLEKNLLNSNTSTTCPHNMVNFGPQRRRSVREFGAPCKFQRVSCLGSIMARHSSSGYQPKLCGVEQRSPRIWQGGHHIGHWPTF